MTDFDIADPETTTPVSNQALRHQIRDLVQDHPISDEVHELLAGRAGLSFDEQRDRAAQVVALVSDTPDTEEFVQARQAAEALLNLVKVRQAEHEAQFTPQARLALAVQRVEVAKQAYIAAETALSEAQAAAQALEEEVLQAEADDEPELVEKIDGEKG